jgi:hypothetical protein
MNIYPPSVTNQVYKPSEEQQRENALLYYVLSIIELNERKISQRMLSVFFSLPV